MAPQRPFRSRRALLLYRDAPGCRTDVEILRWESPAAGQNRNVAGPTARAALPVWDTDRFRVEITVEGHPEMDACYTLAYRRAACKQAGTAPMNITE